MMTATELAEFGRELNADELVSVRFGMARDELASALRQDYVSRSDFDEAMTEYLGAFDDFYFGDSSKHQSDAVAHPGRVLFWEVGQIVEGPFDNIDSIKRYVRRHLASEADSSPASVSRACGFTLLEQIENYAHAEIKD